MVKTVFFRAFYILTAAVVIINSFMSIKNSLFFDINKLPEGDLTYSLASPKKDKTLKVYTVKNSIGVAVRAETVFHGNTRNVFWQTGTDKVGFKWVNNDVITINEVSLNVAAGDAYDCRRGTSLFQEGNLGGKAAPDLIANMQGQR